MTSSGDTAGREQGLAEQASAKAQDAASTAREKAGEVKEQGRNRLADQLDQRTTNVGSQARSFAGAVRRSSDELRGEGSTGAASIAGQAATRIERVGTYLEQKSGDDLLRDVEEFARRRPWLVAGAAALVGLAASRFLKASSEQRYRSRYGYSDRTSSGRARRWDESSASGLPPAPEPAGVGVGPQDRTEAAT